MNAILERAHYKYITVKSDNEEIVKYEIDFIPLSESEFKIVAKFILTNGTKLSQTFRQLPYGIIDKSITGIGATTLELKSKRNSIIVEPLRSIAASKAALNHNGYLYFGSECGEFKNRPTTADVKNYLNRETVKFKKILVVADSLPLLLSIIFDIYGKQAFYESFFLLIDEIDCFQSESTYREALEYCLDIYKTFHFKNRAMITATMLDFTDPFLLNESFCTIDYENPEPRSITLINTNSFEQTISEKIIEISKIYEDAKIAVACPSIDVSLRVIEDLNTHFKVNEGDMKLLCGKGNTKKAGTYYDEIRNEKLPGKINFLTSAYYIGVDINESYCLISTSTYTIPHTLLSQHKLKQIAGRCRKFRGLNVN